MEITSLTAAGKLIMILLCLCGRPQTKETLRIDVISNKNGIEETIVVKPSSEGFVLWSSDQGDAEKLMDIRRDGSPTSLVFSKGKQKFNLEEVFPTANFKDLPTASKVDLKADGIGSIKVTRSGSTVYVAGPAGLTFSIHK